MQFDWILKPAPLFPEAVHVVTVLWLPVHIP
jgi:hypothetical protein